MLDSPPCAWTWSCCLQFSSHAPRPAGRHARAPPDAPPRLAGWGPALTHADTDHRRPRVGPGSVAPCSCVLAEQLAQLGPGMAQTALGGLEAALGDRRDLLDTKIALDLQKERIALFTWELPDGLAKRCCLVPHHHCSKRTDVGFRSQLLNDQFAFVTEGLQAHLLPTGSNGVDHPIACDRKEPRREPLGRLVAVGIASNGEPDLLHQFVRRRPVADIAFKIAPDTHFVPAIKQYERRGVTACVAPHQGLVTLARVRHSSHFGSYAATQPGGSGTNCRSCESGNGLGTGGVGRGRLTIPIATRLSRLS